MRRHYTPEERERIRKDARKMLEEDERRRGRVADEALVDEDQAAAQVESAPDGLSRKGPGCHDR